MLERIKSALIYADVDKDAYRLVKDKIEYANVVTLTIYSLVAFVLTTIMTLLYVFVIRAMSEAWVVFIFGVFGSLIIFILAGVCRKHLKFTYFTIYAAISLFMIYGILMGTLCRPGEQTVTFVVLMLFLPLLFIDRPIRLIASLVFYVTIYLIAAFHTKSGKVLMADVSNAVMFGMLAIVSIFFIVRVKVNGFILEQRLQYMSEKDQLTGLNNRNSYEWHLEEYPRRCVESLGCVYIDVNGLHALNDSEGHKAGDIMLQTIAHIVQENFGKRDTYRIGGDEFLAYTVDWSAAKIEERMRRMQQQVREAGYQVAVGYAISPAETVEMNALTTKAETYMYSDKDEYYRISGKKRRGA
ncbi:MAG: GGDEF domain-containing protein [Lachnospiraceae bacterium]|nr:GGDEF domain-containing protein [Lachnospiraceae bacterium]